MITVRALKYDGKGHRRWSARLLEQHSSLLVLDAHFAEEVQHDLLGVIAAGTQSIEYYWLDRWYNIFRFCEPDGKLRGYYCNVNVPPVFDGSELTYVDLDIDILVHADLSYSVLDLDEFEQNAKTHGYPPDVHENAHRAVTELETLIRSRTFPFNSN